MDDYSSHHIGPNIGVAICMSIQGGSYPEVSKLKEPPAQSADPQARPAKPKRGVKKRQLQQEGEYERSRWHGQYLTNWAPAYGERKSIGSASCSSPVSVVLATLSGCI